jgi:hypothetical protein
VTRRADAVGTFPPVATYLVRLWVPDRPGALGQIASRIGAVHGDVIGIDILERGGGRAIDQLIVTLPDPGLVDLLVAEIGQVDDVAVEEVRAIDPSRRDAPIAALEAATRLVESPPELRLAQLCRALVDLFDGDWASVIALTPPTTVERCGEAPSAGWLSAFIEGSRHLAPGDDAGAPADLAWAALDGCAMAVFVGRGHSTFLRRERDQMALLGRILAGLS